MLLDSKEDVEKISIHHTPITKKKNKKLIELNYIKKHILKNFKFYSSNCL